MEYDVQPDGPGKWNWATYHKISSGMTAKRGKTSAQNESAEVIAEGINHVLAKYGKPTVAT